MSRRARSAVKLVDGLASFSRCWMFSAPTDQPPTRPVRRVPASSGIASPVGDRPICRLKKKIMSCEAFWRPPPAPPPPPPVLPEPNWNTPEFSRKKSRFSGKNRLKRVRLTCCSSASTCEKSVLTVKSHVRPDVTPYFTSKPAS